MSPLCGFFPSKSHVEWTESIMAKRNYNFLLMHLVKHSKSVMIKREPQLTLTTVSIRFSTVVVGEYVNVCT